MVAAVNFAMGQPPKPQRWLAEPWLPRDVMTLAAGGAGILKGTAMATVVADATRGRPYFGSQVTNQAGAGDVIVIAPEDRRDALKFRFKAAGADMTRAWNLTYDGRTGSDGQPGKTRLDEHGLAAVKAMGRWINAPVSQGGRGGRLVLVYIDPLMAVKPKGVSITQDDQVRDHIVDPLDNLARLFGCAVVLLQHTVKDGTIGGSQGLVNAARLVLFFQRVKGSDYRSLSVYKSNIGPDDLPALRYHQVGADSEATRRVEWVEAEEADSEPVIVPPGAVPGVTELYPRQQAQARRLGLSPRELFLQHQGARNA